MSWNINDKEWLKKRKAQWKEVKITLDKMPYNGEDKKKIKNYFLYGPQKESLKYDFDDRLSSVEFTSLLAVWLHPSNDIELIKLEINRFEPDPVYVDNNGKAYYEYIGSGGFVMGSIYNEASPDMNEVFDKKTHALCFNGREQLINQLLMPSVIDPLCQDSCRLKLS